MNDNIINFFSEFCFKYNRQFINDFTELLGLLLSFSIRSLDAHFSQIQISVLNRINNSSMI